MLGRPHRRNLGAEFRDQSSIEIRHIGAEFRVQERRHTDQGRKRKLTGHGKTTTKNTGSPSEDHSSLQKKPQILFFRVQ